MATPQCTWRRNCACITSLNFFHIIAMIQCEWGGGERETAIQNNPTKDSGVRSPAQYVTRKPRPRKVCACAPPGLRQIGGRFRVSPLHVMGSCLKLMDTVRVPFDSFCFTATEPWRALPSDSEGGASGDAFFFSCPYFSVSTRCHANLVLRERN